MHTAFESSLPATIEFAARLLGDVSVETTGTSEPVLPVGIAMTTKGIDIDPVVENEFNRLAAEWRRETRHLSIESERATHLRYQQIIGMGDRALPFIFRDLQQLGTVKSDWFWALSAITRFEPIISSENLGRVGPLTAAWLEWGRHNGFVAR